MKSIKKKITNPGGRVGYGYWIREISPLFLNEKMWHIILRKIEWKIRPLVSNYIDFDLREETEGRKK